MNPCDCRDYREELILPLSSARELALASIKVAQKRYKTQYDKGGDWKKQEAVQTLVSSR